MLAPFPIAQGFNTAPLPHSSDLHLEKNAFLLQKVTGVEIICQHPVNRFLENRRLDGCSSAGSVMDAGHDPALSPPLSLLNGIYMCPISKEITNAPPRIHALHGRSSEFSSPSWEKRALRSSFRSSNQSFRS